MFSLLNYPYRQYTASSSLKSQTTHPLVQILHSKLNHTARSDGSAHDLAWTHIPGSQTEIIRDTVTSNYYLSLLLILLHLANYKAADRT